ncbi:hypothetical protein [Hydrogenophaga pseudoflava]|uniref:hypothetical protein n=1 Tax=Hydrogenophaga pseudoflava TaxID=47421 RepID=UPI0027E407B4|nr:hypothetical protein [Hydrogenophaga pseudoflava]MDQ7743624.1 hypothetical protein [Hydrogenophaga pseudoflava]
MLNISTSQPVSWPSAPLVAVAPVPAASSVGAAQPSARDPQADSGRGEQGARSGASLSGRAGQEPAAGAPAAQHAPILPGNGRKDGERASPADYLADAKLRAEQRQEEDQKAREQAEQKRQLQDVLATVWKASAAVVDVVLGRGEQEPAAADAAAASGVKDVAIPGQGPVANDAQVDLPGVEPVPAALRREQEPVAYTEQGASTWPPLEAGSLLSRRV